MGIYSQDIGMEFGMEKCTMLIMRSSKLHMSEEKELPYQEKIRMLGEKEIYKYLGIFEAVTIKHVEMKKKKKIKNEYLRWMRKLLETKLYSRNLMKGIKTWDVPPRKPSLKWTREELQQIDPRTRKLKTMHKALHPRDDVERLCQEKKEEKDSLAFKIALTHR